jgi:possible phage integrase
MASIQKYKNNNGTFYRAVVYIGIDNNGRQKQKKKSGFKTKKEANMWANKIQLDSGNMPFEAIAQTLTVQELFDDWLEMRRKQIKASTIQQDKYLFFLHILPVIGNIRIDKLNTRHCQLIVNNIYEKRPKSWHAVYNKLKAFINYMYKMEYIAKKPTDKVILPKKEIPKKENYWNKEELNFFLDFCKNKKKQIYYTAYYVLAYTGLRIGELCALTWGDIDFNASTINIDKTVTINESRQLIIGDTKTLSSTNVITIDATTISVLKEWKAYRFSLGRAKPEDIVFDADGEAPYCFYHRLLDNFRRDVKRSGLKRITLHGLRHTHATLLFDAGVTIKAISERLRHAQYSITADIYTHLTEDNKKEVADIFATHLEYRDQS